MTYAEVGGQPARVREVFAARGADREGDAVGMELPHVQQGQRAVQAAGEDHADGEVGVDAHPDAVAEHVAYPFGCLLGIVDRALTCADPQQVDERDQFGVSVSVGPAVIAGRHLADPGSDRHERLDLGCDVQAATVA